MVRSCSKSWLASLGWGSIAEISGQGFFRCSNFGNCNTNYWHPTPGQRVHFTFANMRTQVRTTNQYADSSPHYEPFELG